MAKEIKETKKEVRLNVKLVWPAKLILNKKEIKLLLASPKERGEAILLLPGDCYTFKENKKQVLQ